MKNVIKTAAVLSLTIAAASCASGSHENVIQTEDEVFAIAINNPVPEGTIELLDSFEDGNFWQNSTDDGYSMETDLSSEWYSEGASSAKWNFKAVPKTETAVYYCDALSDRNWEGAKAIILDINNTTSKTIQLYLKIDSGRRPVEYAVTAPVAIGSGTNTNVYFDLEHQLTDLEGNSIPQIQEITNVRKLSIILMGKTKTGSVFTDNIRLVR
ncbi:hypothetical protein [Treponema sp.]|jgi:hypothetical protein|uniref:hypothetical protein n=1 Tax=Treponema sp. TaxID=166 RepID=UPI00257AE905|nr:hypothetical protein [Treponema sp.]MBE6353465.1 hypothetical protein [Treponema sp.]